MTESRIYIVRHGETDENKLHIIQGQLDTEMNEHGLKQAAKVANRLGMVPFEIAYTSDLARARVTAEIILEQHKDVKLESQSALRERNMGKLQGLVWTPKLFSSHEKDADMMIESGGVFTKRLLSWWDESIVRHIQELPPRCMPYHILVTTHGGAIQTLTRALIRSGKIELGKGVSINSQSFNTAVAVVEIDKSGRGTMVMCGDVSHLQELEVIQEKNVDLIDA